MLVLLMLMLYFENDGVINIGLLLENVNVDAINPYSLFLKNENVGVINHQVYF